MEQMSDKFTDLLEVFYSLRKHNASQKKGFPEKGAAFLPAPQSLPYHSLKAILAAREETVELSQFGFC